MRLVIQPNYDLLSEWAANYVAKRINEFAPKEGTPFVLGLPTGSSPLGMYRNLIRLYQEGKVSFRNVVTFNMDVIVFSSVEMSFTVDSNIFAIAVSLLPIGA